MTVDPVKNFAKVTVSTGYTNIDTSIVLSTGNGDKLPDPSIDGFFNLVWYNSTDYPDPSDDPNVEIVRITSRIVDTIIISRAQEGTLASNHNLSGKTYKMILAPTKKLINDLDVLSSNITPGSILFATTGNKIIQDNTNLYWDDTNKRLGIGTNIPTIRLQVVSEQAGGGIAIQGSGTNSPAIGLYNATTFGGSLGLAIASGHILSTSVVNDIVLRSDSNLLFGSLGIERMRITNAGNVGIGTTSPGTKLGITGPGYTEISLYSGDTSYARIWYGTGGSYATTGSSWNAGIRNDSGYGNAFAIESNAGPGWSPKLFITQGGNVGIGTTSPAELFDINGGRLRVTSTTGGLGLAIAIRYNSSAGRGWIGGINDVNGGLWFSGNDIGTTEHMRITNTGNVGIGTTTPGAPLDIGGQFRVSYWAAGSRITMPTNVLYIKSDSVRFTDGADVFLGRFETPGVSPYTFDIYGQCHATSFPTSSDIRFKQNIALLSNVLSRIRYLNGVSFEWNQIYQSLGRGTEGKREIGLIAQEVEQVFPELITTFKAEKDGLIVEDARSIDYGRLTAILVEGIKELINKIDILESKLAQIGV